MRHWLKMLRLRKEMTQSQVAQLAGITTQHYSFIEHGERNPSPTIAKRIAKALGFEDKWYTLLDTDIPAGKAVATCG